MRRRPLIRRGAAIAVALATTLASPGVAAARHGAAQGLHDARYCEIIEIKGSLPNITAVVWNTITLNGCPAAQWNALDATALAKELGDTAVVLNGPRHFLVDSVTATVGRVRAFHGIRTTRVATIPIHTAAELTQTPYTDRTIARINTWHWNRGRTVYELVAPGGDTYVMQSYAQISDPTLTIGKLAALGRRLKPPPGWHYRTRRLSGPYTLTAHGSATIIQDDLQDTYQLATTTRPPGKPARRAVHVDGRTREVKASMPGTIEDHGTLTGSPFGPGSIVLVGKFDNGHFDGTFQLLFARGSVSGDASLPFTVSGNEIDFVGTAHFTRGTGAYRGISSGDLRVHDHNTLDGQNGVLTVDGAATY